MKYSPKSMKENLEEKEFYFKKKFGQNFIIDENIVTSIVEKANVDKDTLVLEIGPGAGSLTTKLASKAGFVKRGGEDFSAGRKVTYTYAWFPLRNQAMR